MNRDGGKGEMARKDEGTLKDGRTAPIFIHSAIDDLIDLTPNTMRVYMHLARRADKSGAAWPSYQSIGDHCFSSVSDNAATRKSFARKAITELIASRLLMKENRARDDGGQTSNVYILLNPPCLIDTPVLNKHGPVPIDTPRAYKAPEDTPSEDTPSEDTPSEGSSSSSASSEPPEKSDDDDDLAFNSVVTAWNEGMPEKATKTIRKKLRELVDDYGPETVTAGILAAVEAGGRSFKYVATCAHNHANGVGAKDEPRKQYSIYTTKLEPRP